jgi:hypothetical protein
MWPAPTPSWSFNSGQSAVIVQRAVRVCVCREGCVCCVQRGGDARRHVRVKVLHGRVIESQRLHARDMSWMGGAPCTHKRPFSVSNPPSFFFISDTDADSDGVNSNGMVLDEALPKQQHGDCERERERHQAPRFATQTVSQSVSLSQQTEICKKRPLFPFGTRNLVWGRLCARLMGRAGVAGWVLITAPALHSLLDNSPPNH